MDCAKNSLEEAKKCYEKAFKASEEVMCRGDMIQSGVGLANIAKREGDYSTATEWYKKALSQRRKASDKETHYSMSFLKQQMQEIKILMKEKKKNSK